MFVFISYSHIDSQEAKRIADFLDKRKVPYFLDQKSIEWGGDINDEIARAIGKATHLIVIVSPASLKSGWVAYEIGRAHARGIVTLPFLVHSALELPSFIRNVRHVSSLDEIECYFESKRTSELPIQLSLQWGHTIGNYCSPDLPDKVIFLARTADGSSSPADSPPGLGLEVVNVSTGDLQLKSPCIVFKPGARFDEMSFPSYGDIPEFSHVLKCNFQNYKLVLYQE